MRIFKDPKELQQYALELKRSGKRIGLVPTMGYLHAGHLSLIDRAKQDADVVMFIHREDYYEPETAEKDI